VAEDDPDFRDLLGEILQESGFRVALFATGDDLLRALAHLLPDAIVTDIVMPGLWGSALLARVRQNDRWRQIPVIVLTGNNDTALPMRLDAPVVAKPDIEQLLRTLRGAIGTVAALQKS
jgi:CheY-like chemotaxis protein